MKNEVLDVYSQSSGLKDRLFRATAKLTISFKAPDDALIKELHSQLGGHFTGSTEQKEWTLMIEDDVAASLIAMSCGIAGVYEAKKTPRPLRLLRPGSKPQPNSNQPTIGPRK